LEENAESTQNVNLYMVDFEILVGTSLVDSLKDMLVDTHTPSVKDVPAKVYHLMTSEAL